MLAALKVRNMGLKTTLYGSFRAEKEYRDFRPGATHFVLAPGFHISRLWRCLAESAVSEGKVYLSVLKLDFRHFCSSSRSFPGLRPAFRFDSEQ